MRILYVEDNAVNLSLIARIAQMNKHDLVSHKDAESALAALDAGLKVDLILLDIQLAGEMDGIGFAKTVRTKGRTEPIIAITAYAMTGDKERIIEAGCNEYLPKPLPIAEFLTLLAKYDPSVKKATSDAASQPRSGATPQPAETTSQPGAPPPPASKPADVGSNANQSISPAPKPTDSTPAPTPPTSQPTDSTPAPTPPTSQPTGSAPAPAPPTGNTHTPTPPADNKDQNKAAIPVGTASRREGGKSE